MAMTLVVVGNTVTGIYNDDVYTVLRGLGVASVQRASHVEPGTDGLWYADLAPVGGPVLGPYQRRQDALTAEVVWLDEHLQEIAIKAAKGLDTAV